MAALTFGLGSLLVGAGSWGWTIAHAAGCEVLDDPADRVRCEARAEARSAARAEVERQLAGGAGAGEAGGLGATTTPGQAATRSADWQAAVDEANAFDPSAVLEPRPLAAVIGLAWFALVLRSRRRARQRARA